MQQAIKEITFTDYPCHHLTSREQVLPQIVITKFCSTYSPEYITRELEDFLDAVECYEGPLRTKASECLSCNYLKMLTLAKAGFALVKKQYLLYNGV